MFDRVGSIPLDSPACDMVWSDPADLDPGELWATSPRGAGYLFGEPITRAFNHINGL